MQKIKKFLESDEIFSKFFQLKSNFIPILRTKNSKNPKENEAKNLNKKNFGKGFQNKNQAEI